MPPMPRIPSTFPCGSCPRAIGSGEPFHLPARRFCIPALKLRRAPIIKNMLTSAVDSSTAVGTLETRSGGDRALQAAISTWSYPEPGRACQYNHVFSGGFVQPRCIILIPQWARNSMDFGKASTNSWSIRPVIETDPKVR